MKGKHRMTDYTELIKNLKYLSDTVRYPFVKKLHAGILMKEAADAIERLQKERDAAVKDLQEADNCNYCKYRERAGMEEPCCWCDVDEGEDKWEWRGVDE